MALPDVSCGLEPEGDNDDLRRRVVIFHADREILVELLNAFKGATTVCLPVLDSELPEGAVVADVSVNHQRRCLDILVSHESFDVVPDGAYPAESETFLRHKMFRRVPLELEPVEGD